MSLNNCRITTSLLMALLLIGCAERDPSPMSKVDVAAVSEPEFEVGLTGKTHPEAVIEARQEIMAHMEALLKPIDTMQTGAVGDPVRIQENAAVIGTMLHAVPHLFAPTTNRYQAGNPLTPTTALPAIWEKFDLFYTLSERSITAAESLAQEQGGPGALKDGGARLRATCDNCHSLFVRKYTPPVFLPSDAEFDFDSALATDQAAASDPTAAPTSVSEP